MWNGLGPRQYRMLRPGTVVQLRGRRPNDHTWHILQGYRRDCGHISYRMEGTLPGYLTLKITFSMHDIKKVVGTRVRMNGSWIVVPMDRHGAIMDIME